jgi:hypothetical protein
MKGWGSQMKTHIKTRLNFVGLLWRRSASFASARQGYTIVEVMIFLAVTMGLFAMIAGTFSGRQATTEFSVAAREMESRLQDIANDVSTGFYNNPGTFRCTLSGGAPLIDTVSPTAQGTNNACIFIGRVVQFDLATSAKDFNLYSVVGARQASGHDVLDFNEAHPRALANPVSPVDLTEAQQIPPGLVTRSMYADYGGTLRRIRAVGFFSTFGGTSASVDSTSLNVNVIPLGFAPTGNAKADVVSNISTITNAYFSSFANPSGGVLVCMDGDRTDQHALLKLGGNNRQLTTDLTIGGGTCNGAGYPT